MTKVKPESMSSKIWTESIDLDYRILSKATDLVAELKKHSISNWKVKNNKHKLIHELDFMLESKYELLAALTVVEKIEESKK
tara:strand:- start:347 stop:592 length:246 start_codon:yes stop_codon:yes gene_type:complete